MARMDGLDEGSQPDQRADFELLPRGRYLAKIIETEVTDNNAKTGKLLRVTEELVGDGFKGRRVWTNINLTNASAKAQTIGQSELAALKVAVGLPLAPIPDTLILHDKVHCIDVEIELAEPGTKYKDKNIVKRYFPASEINAGEAPAPAAATQASAPAANAPAPRPAAPASTPAAPAASAPRPPWMKAAA